MITLFMSSLMLLDMAPTPTENPKVQNEVHISTMEYDDADLARAAKYSQWDIFNDDTQDAEWARILDVAIAKHRLSVPYLVMLPLDNELKEEGKNQ
jgi:hypothetical protein